MRTGYTCSSACGGEKQTELWIAAYHLGIGFVWVAWHRAVEKMGWGQSTLAIHYTMCVWAAISTRTPAQTPGFHSPASSRRQWTGRLQLNITEAGRTLDRECKEYILFALINWASDNKCQFWKWILCLEVVETRDESWANLPIVGFDMFSLWHLYCDEWVCRGHFRVSGYYKRSLQYNNMYLKQ